MCDDRIAIILKTYERPVQLLTTLASIEQYCNVPYRLYIGDDGVISPEVAAAYDRLQTQGHVLLRFRKHLNVTVARNRLLDVLGSEEFVLRIDDDFKFGARTDFEDIRTISLSRPEVSVLTNEYPY
jgi:glycosyltransferase involved in cell wall biosynthesis